MKTSLHWATCTHCCTSDLAESCHIWAEHSIGKGCTPATRHLKIHLAPYAYVYIYIVLFVYKYIIHTYSCMSRYVSYVILPLRVPVTASQTVGLKGYILVYIYASVKRYKIQNIYWEREACSHRDIGDIVHQKGPRFSLEEISDSKTVFQWIPWQLPSQFGTKLTDDLPGLPGRYHQGSSSSSYHHCLWSSGEEIIQVF